MKQIGILSFTERGKRLSHRIAEGLGDDCNVEILEDKGKAKEYLRENFQQKDVFLFICAAGIAVRMIAPLIRSKDVDPAVIVMDEFGRFVVPILSGHLGGANAAAAGIAELIEAQLVLTTATDINDNFAVDVWSKYVGCRIVDVRGIKDVSSAVLRGEKIGFESGFPFEGKLPEELTLDPAEMGICVSLSDKLKPFKKTFNVVPQIVTLGVGCRKNVSADQFEKFILNVLEENNVSIYAVEKIASIDLKKYEKCILSFSDKYKIPFVTYTAEELKGVSGEFLPSDFVKSVTGVDNVCERSAVLGSGNGQKILSKASGSGVTAALAMKDWKCKF